MVKPPLDTYRIWLVTSAAISPSFYNTTKAAEWAIFPQFIPFSTISHVFTQWALPIAVTLKYLELLTITLSRMAPVVLTRLTIFCKCNNGKQDYFIWSREAVMYCITFNQIPCCRRQIYVDSFGWEFVWHLTNYHIIWYLTSTEWWSNATQFKLWHFQRVFNISECIDALTSNGSTFYTDMSASIHLSGSGSHALLILCRMIYWANGLSHYTVAQQSRYNWGSKGKVCGEVVWTRQSIQQDFNTWRSNTTKNSCVRQQGYCPAKLLHTFCCSDRMYTQETNINGSVIWPMLHHDLLFVTDLEYNMCTMLNRTHGMKMCLDTLQSVQCIIDSASVLEPVQLVWSGEDQQYLQSQCATLEIYNMID